MAGPVTGACTQVTAQELRRLLAQRHDMQLIDVREPVEFAQQHIPGAMLLPLGQLPARMREIDPTRLAILVCRSGNRSAIACQFLRARGYHKVVNFAGGMLSWNEIGGPTATGLE
ncbi:sulfurtransferase [Caldinitratiruptor microaerophilus]|uniref:Sulfurtransferase n=1 Tax=Caldinitratiruptor microaerophilus TaxID=671077 RepID=A0AA35G8L4_9FIRM|nr:sulfurtransferase [Caldinitratiruptor microaerophilus]